MKKYVEYIRVSTSQQGDSGLGLSAQEQAISRFIANCDGQSVAKYTEIETGTRKERIRFNSKLSLSELLAKRPVLMQAIQTARKSKATLIVKEHSRLTRSKLVIEWMMAIGLDFVCADSPSDSPQIISIKVGFYEEEAKKISERTAAALNIKRQTSGEWRKGNNAFNSGLAAIAGTAKIKKQARSNPNNKIAAELICHKLEQGWKYQRIADYLNDKGLTTSKGAKFTTTQVGRINLMFCKEKTE